MGVYDRPIATALRLIERFGQVCEWHKGDLTHTDPDRPWAGGARSDIIMRPSIAFLPATDGASGFGLSKFRADTELADFSTFGLMGAQDFEPEVSDRVLRDGAQLTIKSIEAIKPADQVVLYVLSID